MRVMSGALRVGLALRPRAARAGSFCAAGLSRTREGTSSARELDAKQDEHGKERDALLCRLDERKVAREDLLEERLLRRLGDGLLGLGLGLVLDEGVSLRACAARERVSLKCCRAAGLRDLDELLTCRRTGSVDTPAEA